MYDWEADRIVNKVVNAHNSNKLADAIKLDQHRLVTVVHSKDAIKVWNINSFTLIKSF